MMNTPSMYSVDQLLKARKDGVPDYVVVPMLQKAMAQKQAMAQQQALQQGAPKPPVAQQILDAAHNDVMQEHMARQVEEKPEPRGIDSLPSGIDEGDYAGGGIVAFAGNTDGSLVQEYPTYDASAFEPQYKDKDLDPMARKEEFLNTIGKDPAIAKQEARIGEREARLKEDEDRSPWLALMHAGLATMAGTSPNALANIGAGATKGLESYGESKKNLSARADKLDDLRSKIEESQRAEVLAAAKFGNDSVEHRQAQNHTDRLEGAKAREMYTEHKYDYLSKKEKNAIDRLNVESDAAYKSGHLSLEREKLAQLKAGAADGLTAAQARKLKGIDGDIKDYQYRLENDMRPGAQEHYTKILDDLYNERRAVEGKPAIEGFTPPAKPVEKRSTVGKMLDSMNPWADDEPAPAGKLPVNPKTGNYVYTR